MSQTNNWFHDLFIDEVKGALNGRGGGGNGSGGGITTIITPDNMIMSDRTTNKNYELYVDEGKLSMEETDGDIAATDASYFNIDADGKVSLKPEYRGNPTSTEFSYAVSDNGVGKDGSKLNELPEKIVFPSIINGVKVTGVQPGMFYYNYRVKEIVFPDGVTKLPASFCRNARYLTSIKNTEHITTLENRAFMNTRIDTALFPNLTSVDQRAFLGCYLLHTADIGNTITAIPESFFHMCFSLSLVKGGSNIKSVGKRSFFKTRSLKSLSFSSQLTSVGEEAFFNSRIHVDENTFSAECSFGNAARPDDDNKTDYWTDAEYTPCENRMVSLFNQKNPEWADLQIGDMIGAPEGDDKPLTYKYGCSFVALCHIHSAITGYSYASPKEFEEWLKEWLNKKGKSDLLSGEGTRALDKRLGLMTELFGEENVKSYEDPIDQESYKDICDALKRGGYVYMHASDIADIDSVHIVVLYGINADGEVFVADSDTGSESNLIYDDLFRYRMPLQNFTGPDSDFIIIEAK